MRANSPFPLLAPVQLVRTKPTPPRKYAGIYGAGVERSPVISCFTIRTSIMFGVNGGIFAPVRRAWSGTMRRPVPRELGVTDGEAFFPNATTPPRTTVPIRRIVSDSAKKTAPGANLEPFWNNPQISELLFYRHIEEPLDRIGLPEVKTVTAVLVDRQWRAGVKDIFDTKRQGSIR